MKGAPTVLHVVPHLKGTWGVKSPRRSRAVKVGFEARMDAIRYAWDKGAIEVVIHNEKGSIERIERKKKGGKKMD